MERKTGEGKRIITRMFIQETKTLPDDSTAIRHHSYR
jgi:hypothetical protein